MRRSDAQSENENSARRDSFAAGPIQRPRPLSETPSPISPRRSAPPRPPRARCRTPPPRRVPLCRRRRRASRRRRSRRRPACATRAWAESAPPPCRPASSEGSEHMCTEKGSRTGYYSDPRGCACAPSKAAAIQPRRQRDSGAVGALPPPSSDGGRAVASRCAPRRLAAPQGGSRSATGTSRRRGRARSESISESIASRVPYLSSRPGMGTSRRRGREGGARAEGGSCTSLHTLTSFFPFRYLSLSLPPSPISSRL